MNSLLILSVGNLLLSAAVSAMIYGMSRHSKNLGKQQVPFRAERIRRRGKGKMWKPYLYMVHVRFKDTTFSRLVSEEEYQRICKSPYNIAEVYIREFTHVLCSPDWQKYQFSLTETDWCQQDWKRCSRLFLFIFIVWEILILFFTLQW